jgi:hypothetical protein
VSPSVTPSTTQTPTPTDTPTVVTATPSATPSQTPTASPTGTPALGGQITYYNGAGPVPGVEVDLIGGSPATAMTDANGDYGFSFVGSGMVTVLPLKHDDVNNAITALDASFVLQFVAGLRTFTDDQRLAADVTGDGTVSTLDASLILQYQANLLGKCSISLSPCSTTADCPPEEVCEEHFPVAQKCGSDWVFRPDPTIVPNQTLVQPQTGGGSCQRGAIVYDPASPPVAGQDFVGILFGDATGNWTPPSP